MELENYGDTFAFRLEGKQPQQQKATITIHSMHVNAIYNEALHSQKKVVQTVGFSRGETPLSYIEQHFKAALLEHVKEVLFNHCVIHFLYQCLRENHLVLIGEPDLVSIELEPNKDALFIFSLQTIRLVADTRWKKITMKPIDRKHYRDLDRQVQSFVEEEQALLKNHLRDTIVPGDWVQFDISLYGDGQVSLMPGFKSSMWVSVVKDEGDKNQQDLFVDKKPGDSFFTRNTFLQENFSLSQDLDYIYFIEIKDFVPAAFTSFDLVRHQFGLEENSDPAEKLIEVFSTRKDMTLRRERIEALFKQLIKQYFFTIPTAQLDNQANLVLKEVQDSYDYHVYKSQEDFMKTIYLLAEKQLREAIIIDTLAIQEKIELNEHDVQAYLNLLSRPRMKDFVYFGHPGHKEEAQEVPVSSEIIKRYCLREKTLNHILSSLSKKAKV